MGCPCHSTLLFLSFPTFSSLQQPFPVKAIKGLVLSSSPLLYQAASSSLAQGPHWQREARRNPFPLHGPADVCLL